MISNLYWCFCAKMQYSSIYKETSIRLLSVLKTSKKNVWGNVFWYVNVCIFWKCVQYTIHWDRTQMLKIFLRTKQTVQKMHSSFFRKFQLTTVLLLICDSYISWRTRFFSLKMCVRFSIFDSFFLLKFLVLFNKMHGLLI